MCSTITKTSRGYSTSSHHSEPGKRANVFFTPQGDSCLVEKGRGHSWRPTLRAVADGWHNTRHCVNDGHQTGSIRAARTDEWRSRRVWVFVDTFSVVFLLSHISVQRPILGCKPWGHLGRAGLLGQLLKHNKKSPELIQNQTMPKQIDNTSLPTALII